MNEDPGGREVSDADIERLIEQHWEALRPPPKLPWWLPAAMRVLPYTLLAAAVVNGLIGIVAILTPYLAAAFGSGVSGPIYSAYSFICPQRPSHTFFLAGHPMAFEHRDLSMHLGFALAGLLYVWAGYPRRGLPAWGLVAGVAPMLVDVAISTAGILPATAVSRTWTGALASTAIVWWSYPRFDGMLARVRRHVELIEAKQSAPQPRDEWFVVADSSTQPANERL